LTVKTEYGFLLRLQPGKLPSHLDAPSASYTGLMLYLDCPITTACATGSATCIAYSQSSTGSKSLCATVVAGSTYYLVLDSWPSPACNAYNNLSISAVSTTGPACSTLLGTGVTNVATLPYNSGAGTTCGAGNDLTPLNTNACGATYYLDGEDRVWVFTPAVSGQITINLDAPSATLHRTDVIPQLPGLKRMRCSCGCLYRQCTGLRRQQINLRECYCRINLLSDSRFMAITNM
jgi:hypothetical protein